jgi:hypothetical protein
MSGNEEFYAGSEHEHTSQENYGGYRQKTNYFTMDNFIIGMIVFLILAIIGSLIFLFTSSSGTGSGSGTDTSTTLPDQPILTVPVPPTTTPPPTTPPDSGVGGTSPFTSTGLVTTNLAGFTHGGGDLAPNDGKLTLDPSIGSTVDPDDDGYITLYLNNRSGDASGLYYTVQGMYRAHGGATLKVSNVNILNDEFEWVESTPTTPLYVPASTNSDDSNFMELGHSNFILSGNASHTVIRIPYVAGQEVQDGVIFIFNDYRWGTCVTTDDDYSITDSNGWIKDMSTSDVQQFTVDGVNVPIDAICDKIEFTIDTNGDIKFGLNTVDAFNFVTNFSLIVEDGVQDAVLTNGRQHLGPVGFEKNRAELIMMLDTAYETENSKSFIDSFGQFSGTNIDKYWNYGILKTLDTSEIKRILGPNEIDGQDKYPGSDVKIQGTTPNNHVTYLGQYLTYAWDGNNWLHDVSEAPNQKDFVVGDHTYRLIPGHIDGVPTFNTCPSNIQTQMGVDPDIMRAMKDIYDIDAPTLPEIHTLVADGYVMFGVAVLTSDDDLAILLAAQTANPSYYIVKPTTEEAFRGTGPLMTKIYTPGDEPVDFVEEHDAILKRFCGSGLVRGVLQNPVISWDDSSTFYKTALPDPTMNGGIDIRTEVFSKILHANAISWLGERRAYTFPFDDVNANDASLEANSSDLKYVIIDIPPWN